MCECVVCVEFMCLCCVIAFIICNHKHIYMYNTNTNSTQYYAETALLETCRHSENMVHEVCWQCVSVVSAYIVCLMCVSEGSCTCICACANCGLISVCTRVIELHL